jgi:hypothetical protein
MGNENILTQPFLNFDIGYGPEQVVNHAGHVIDALDCISLG